MAGLLTRALPPLLRLWGRRHHFVKSLPSFCSTPLRTYRFTLKSSFPPESVHKTLAKHQILFGTQRSHLGQFSSPCSLQLPVTKAGHLTMSHYPQPLIFPNVSRFQQEEACLLSVCLSGPVLGTVTLLISADPHSPLRSTSEESAHPPCLLPSGMGLRRLRALCDSSPFGHRRSVSCGF